MSKVYAYCRVAFADEEEMTQQKQVINWYCEDNGLKIDKYFCDNGVSGLASHRDEFNKMLYTLQNGDIVVVKDAARLSRSVKEYILFVELMNTLDVTLKIIY